MLEDYFVSSTTDSWTFSDSSEQCIDVFIISDGDFEGPVPETINASFTQDGFETQVTIICIMDDDPGNNFIHACML